MSEIIVKLDYSQVCSGANQDPRSELTTSEKSGSCWMEAVLGADQFALEVTQL